MNTDLIPAGTQALTTVEDVSENISLVAEHPADMQVAQARLAEWFREKVSIIERDLDDAFTNLEIAMKQNWKSTTFERQHRVTAKRLDFYKKCLAAVEAGYSIVPNFPVDVFAIRTARKKPRKAESDMYWSTFPQVSQELPLGSGRYVEPLPVVYQKTVFVKDAKTGLEEPKTKYWPNHFDEEIEFPISIAKPQVMEATQRAMAAKIFDEIGCLPTRRARKGDPIVTGAVKMRTGLGSVKQVTFLIAWWIDTRML